MLAFQHCHSVTKLVSLRHNDMVCSRWPASSLALLLIDCLLPSKKWILLMKILPEYSFIDSRNVRKLTKTYIRMSKLMPSFLAIYPKRTKLCFVFWCLKKGLRKKCSRGTSDVLHIVPVLKKIHKDSQSVTPSRRGIAQVYDYEYRTKDERQHLLSIDNTTLAFSAKVQSSS